MLWYVDTVHSAKPFHFTVYDKYVTCSTLYATGAMSDPRDIDEDAILKGLSPEELDQLEYELAEMDPEVWGSA